MRTRGRSFFMLSFIDAECHLILSVTKSHLCWVSLCCMSLWWVSWCLTLKAGSWDCIHNTSFSSRLTNGPNKLECYIALRWKHLPIANTLASWAHLQLEMKMKGCEHGPRIWKKVFNCIKHASLLLHSVNYWSLSFYNTSPLEFNLWRNDIF